MSEFFCPPFGFKDDGGTWHGAMRTGLARSLRRLGSLAFGLRRRRRARAVAGLMALDPRLLEDIGVTQGDLLHLLEARPRG